MTKIYESPDSGETVYEREFGETEHTLIKSEDEMCVACDSVTPYKVTDHIDTRMHYVEGAGQLCKICWDKIYGIQ